MSVAKKIRLGKILNPNSQRGIIVPIDHGLTMGPISGLESSQAMAKWLTSDRIDALIAHKGMISRLAERGLLGRRGVILHLNGMNTLADQPDDKEMLTSLEMAARLGVDAVSLQINFTGKNDAANWKMLGHVADEAQRLGFPVLTMLYDKVRSENSDVAVARLRQLLRVAVELGTDAIKIGMPENMETLASILDPVRDDAMIFLAGGEVADQDQLLRQVARAVSLGISGVCMGRNVFANRDSAAFLDRLSNAVHRGVTRPKYTPNEVAHAF